jgi:hypothetical protein
VTIMLVTKLINFGCKYKIHFFSFILTLLVMLMFGVEKVHMLTLRAFSRLLTIGSSLVCSHLCKRRCLKG